MEIEASLAHRAGLSSSKSQMEWMNVAIDLNRCRSIQRLHHLQNSEAPIGCSDMQAAFVWQHIWQIVNVTAAALAELMIWIPLSANLFIHV